MPYYDDNGNELDPTTIVMPDLCQGCDKRDDPDEEILCNLNRLEQRLDSELECRSYVSRYGVLVDDIIE